MLRRIPGTPIDTKTIHRDPSHHHRILTIMFVDMVGSMTIAYQSGIDHYDGVLTDFHYLTGTVVRNYGGTILQHHGDGAVACFGAQYDGEDAALAAIACALSLTAQASIQLDGVEMRVGLHTGPVMWHGARADNLLPPVTGYHASLAARIQQVAPRNGVMASAQTRAFVSRIASLEVGEKTIVSTRADEPPIEAWQLTGYRLKDEYTRTLHGRDEYIERLSHPSRMSGRHGAVIVGGIGIGKTALMRQLASAGPSLHIEARHHFMTTPLYPITVCLGQQLFDGAAASRDTLQAALTRLNLDFGGAEVDALRALLGRPTTRAADLSPEGRRKERIDVGARVLLRLLTVSGARLFVDDLQWADSDTLSVLERVIGNPDLPSAGVLLASRPVSWLPNFTNMLNLDTVVLSPLHPDAAAAMIGDAPMVGVIDRDRLIERSEGNPLFLLTMTDHLARTGDAIPATIILPDTVEAACQAMIAAFGDEREAIFAAAVLGRAFSLRHLLMLMPEKRGLADQMAYLTISGLLERTEDGYAFSHGLLRDTAYAMMSIRHRQIMHGRVLTALQDHDPEYVAAFLPAMADHAIASNDPATIVPACLAAGIELLQGAHFDLAIDYLNAALSHMAEDPGMRDPRYLSTLARIASAQVQRFGFAHPKVIATYRQLEAEVERGGGPLDRAVVLYGVFAYVTIGGQVADGGRLVDQMAQVGTAAGGIAELLWRVNDAAYGLYSGDFDRSAAACAHVEALYDVERDGRLFIDIGADPLASVLSARAHLEARSGRTDLARQTLDVASTHLNAIGAVTQLPWILIFGAAALHFGGDPAEASRNVERGIALADQQSASFWSLVGRLWQGVFLVRDGEVARGQAQLESLLAHAEGAGIGINRSMFLAALADAYLQAGDPASATAFADKAELWVNDAGDRLFADDVAIVVRAIRSAQPNAATGQFV